jgi:hypothetical protein
MANLDPATVYVLKAKVDFAFKTSHPQTERVYIHVGGWSKRIFNKYKDCLLPKYRIEEMRNGVINVSKLSIQ